jgi:DNA-binding Lrp family transcriptional regulator
MRSAKLDRIDRKILKNLQANGRMSNVDLAKEVGISAPPCLRRVRALEEAGYIKGYNAQLNLAHMGYGITVFVLVKLENLSSANKVTFENYIDKLPNVRECHLIAGDIDYILKVVAKNWEDYQDFLRNELTNAPNVSSAKSCLSMNTSKAQPSVPMDDE